MLLEDQRRLQRERDIFLSTRGGDYSALLQSIGRNKADARARAKLQGEYDSKAAMGFAAYLSWIEICGRQSIVQLKAHRRRITRNVQQSRANIPDR